MTAHKVVFENLIVYGPLAPELIEGLEKTFTTVKVRFSLFSSRSYPLERS